MDVNICNSIYLLIVIITQSVSKSNTIESKTRFSGGVKNSQANESL